MGDHPFDLRNVTNHLQKACGGGADYSDDVIDEEDDAKNVVLSEYILAWKELNKALEYVVRLIKDMKDSEETDKMASVARKAYDETLANYHPWLVRKAVHFAVHTLPHRQELIESVSGHLEAVNAEKAMEEMVDAGHGVYDRIQLLYSTNHLLNLP